VEQLTPRKQNVLDAIDTEIEALEQKLAKYQPYFAELEQLRATRRVLLSERGVTATGAARHRLSMESVIHYLQENEPAEVKEIAQALGVPDSTVRSHLNRNKDVRYDSTDEGWVLIGEEEE
jgi:hypothetical protein